MAEKTEEALVRFNPYRTKKLNQVKAILSKEYTRTVQSPEAIELLMDRFLQEQK